jgi:signal transduction histidine kinase
MAKDGSQHWIVWQDALVPGHGVVGVGHDVTERKRAEAALLAKDEEIGAMTQQLWHTAKLATMGELAAGIAHELNNPLATVSLRTEALLADLPADDPQRRALDIIAQEVERMGKLVANLLHSSRRAEMQKTSTDMREEIEKTLELLHYHLRKRQIKVIQHFAPDVPLVLADRQQFRQVFLNLFTNASDAMLPGGRLTLRVHVQESDDHRAPEVAPWVVVEISDTGRGIPPGLLSKVWEPFYTTKPAGQGTGLGLPICRRIIEAHGGTIDISSVPYQGTTIRIVLPTNNVKHLS